MMTIVISTITAIIVVVDALNFPQSINADRHTNSRIGTLKHCHSHSTTDPWIMIAHFIPLPRHLLITAIMLFAVADSRG